MSKILKLNTLRPEKALDNLNRVTGLDFDSWPESLVNHAETPGRVRASATRSEKGQPERPPQRFLTLRKRRASRGDHAPTNHSIIGNQLVRALQRRSAALHEQLFHNMGHARIAQAQRICTCSTSALSFNRMDPDNKALPSPPTSAVSTNTAFSDLLSM